MTELIRITPEERAAILDPASSVLTVARKFQVTTDQQYEDAATLLKVVKSAQKQLGDKKAALINPINQALRAVRDLFRRPEDELEEAEGLYKRAMLGYSEEQEAKRREEQRRLDEAAERDRRRLAREALEAEERAQAARQAGDIRKAEQLEAKADQRTDAAAAVVAPIAQRESPRVGGIAERENWYALCVDLRALVTAIAAGTVPLSAVEPNMKVLNAQARSLRKELNWPGVKAVVEKIMAAGSK